MRYHIKSCLFQFTGFDSNILEFHMIYLRIRHRFFFITSGVELAKGR